MNVAANPLDHAYGLLRAGRYREGFAALETRRQRETLAPRRTGKPEWAGEPLDGQHIVIWGEQGLGDEIMMARFLRPLRAAGAQVTYVCQKPNMRLLVGCGATWLANRGSVVTPPPFDYWLGALSLPHRLGVTVENLSGAAYLRRPEAQRSGGVGLVWRGNAGFGHDRFRSMPSPDLLAEAFPDGVFMEPEGDMLDSARKLLSLDALVTTDTSWVHLAGALGVPTFVLISDQYPEWRWGAAGDRTPWYDSVTICRQDAPGDWPSAVAKAVAHLR
ncbi:hypothetical protein [Phenylobacterium deserti]|uniref:Glycosyltransferase family 9 protein n=1 Tax=Phenylobacterium deserti TaxID=1914756 RepID=A0A328ADB9_9CAUL|nr:hypothetical protein [Phenylobacterium deserti]RAK52762.1 hypothetical protein DJ018_11275 [Phenylobacterium deserti]